MLLLCLRSTLSLGDAVRVQYVNMRASAVLAVHVTGKRLILSVQGFKCLVCEDLFPNCIHVLPSSWYVNTETEQKKAELARE